MFVSQSKSETVMLLSKIYKQKLIITSIHHFYNFSPKSSVQLEQLSEKLVLKQLRLPFKTELYSKSEMTGGSFSCLVLLQLYEDRVLLKNF